jgi:hypothetical protein
MQLFACLFFLTARRRFGFNQRLGIFVATHERFCQGTRAVGMRSKRDVVRHPKRGCTFFVRCHDLGRETVAKCQRFVEVASHPGVVIPLTNGQRVEARAWHIRDALD